MAVPFIVHIPDKKLNIQWLEGANTKNISCFKGDGTTTYGHDLHRFDTPIPKKIYGLGVGISTVF